MPTTHQIAAELRKLAENFEAHEDIEAVTPYLFFSFSYGGISAKGAFLSLVKALPRPLSKTYGKDDFRISYDNPALKVAAYIERSKVCRLVKPAAEAEYECEPLLSVQEEEAMHG